MREDWIECKSSDLLDVRDGTHDTPKYIYDGGFPLITSKNLIKGNIDFSNTKFISEIDMNLINQRSKVDIGDILFAMIGTIGNPVVVKEEPRFSIKNIGLFKNRIKAVDSLLFKYFLDSPLFLNQLDKRQLLKGTTQKFIPLGSLRDIDFPLAPLPEQRAIVKKLESLFSSLDAGVADLKKAQQQLKIYRQAVLKKAFENIKSEISLEEIKQDSLIGLVKSNAEQNATMGVPYIKMNNINMDGGTDIKNVVYVDASASEIEKYSLLKGDILINTRNSFELVGKSGVIKSDLNNYTFNNNLMRLRLKSGINPFFIFYQIIGPSMRKMMVAEKKATTSICALYQRDIFPLKAKMIENIEEQNEIVKQIESRLSVCDSIEQNIKESLVKAEALRQSILKKAFEGNLLTTQELAECKQAADYEPADVLLERIKAEHSKVSKPKKKTKTT